MSVQELTDVELAGQPAAYWTRLAYEALIGFTRASQARHGFTQPEFWLLRHLSKHDLSPDGRGRTVPELRQAMSEYLRSEDDLESEADALVTRGWLRQTDDGRLWITDAGERGLLELKKFGPAIRADIHRGIDDADYVTTLKVLRRMIENTQGRKV